MKQNWQLFLTLLYKHSLQDFAQFAEIIIGVRVSISVHTHQMHHHLLNAQLWYASDQHKLSGQHFTSRQGRHVCLFFLIVSFDIFREFNLRNTIRGLRVHGWGQVFGGLTENGSLSHDIVLDSIFFFVCSLSLEIVSRGKGGYHYGGRRKWHVRLWHGISKDYFQAKRG